MMGLLFYPFPSFLRSVPERIFFPFCALFLEESFLCYLIFDPDTAAGIRVSFSMFVYFASAFCSRLASLDV